MRGNRLRLVLGAVVLVAVAFGAVWFVKRDRGPKLGPPLPPEMAQPAAEEACNLLRQFEQQVDQNDDAERTLATLDRAVVATDRAARADVIWVPLDSGAKALRLGFRKNDAQATRVGIDVVRNACADVIPPVPGP